MGSCPVVFPSAAMGKGEENPYRTGGLGMFYLELFGDYLKQYLKTKLAYRMDFFNEIVSNFIFQIVNLVFILVVFQHTTLIKGWNRDEIIFIYGFFLILCFLFYVL